MWVDVSGSVKIQSVGPDRYAFRLLKAMLLQFGPQSRQFYQATEDLPYAYNEAQLHSVMFPTFRDVCEVVFREQPLYRRERIDGEIGGHGQLDYWLERKARTTLLELKHARLKTRSRIVHTDAMTKWRECLAQVDTVVGYGGPDLLAEGFRADVVGLLVTSYNYTGKTRDSDISKRKDLWRLHREVLEQLEGADLNRRLINWHALWMAPKDMWRNDAHTWPAVSFFATVSSTTGGAD